MKWIDIPPVWLLAALVLAYAQATFAPLGLTFGPVWADLLGGLLVGGGIFVIALAALEFRRHRTTIIPHLTPDALITTGIFSRTRNPIYLGDSLILAGLILHWDAVLSLALVPLFAWVIDRRFIASEEKRLESKFVAQFQRYAQQTRRWL